MATRWQFGMRWLLLLTFLVAAWAALACSYESFLGPTWRVKAFVVACSGLSAAVVWAAASATPPVALFHRLLRRPLTVHDYQLISRRLTQSLIWLGACVSPFVAIAYFDVITAEQLLEMPRGIVLSIMAALLAAILILAAWCAGLIVIMVKAARCRCPACDQRLNHFNTRRWSTECAHCQAILQDRNPKA